MSPTVYANECEAFYKQLTQCISEEKLIALAQEHKLVKRKRKLSIPEKINFLFAASERQIYSYKECAQHVYTQTGQHITPQGIKKMYSAQTAKFAEDTAKAVLAVCMQHPIQRICNSHFTEIYLQDSTAFQLPKELASKFKGYGGDDTGSVAKIQFAYDCLSDKIKFMELGDVNKSDAQYACPKNILKSGLYIRDLGYWKLQALEEIHKAGAYFISRLHDQIKLYKSEEKKSEEIDIEVV